MYNSSKHQLIIQNKSDRRTVNIESATCSIGRDPKNIIVLDSPKISRYHATLLRITSSGTDSYHFRVIDGDLSGKRSTNGIEVNGKSCFSYDLQDGDVITFYKGISATYQIIETASPVNVDVLKSAFVVEENEDSRATQFIDNPERVRKGVSYQTHSMSAEERQASIQQSLERLASFPELFSDPIVEIDLKGNITYLNPAALKRFPNLKQERLNHPILAGIVPLVKMEERTSMMREITIEDRVFEQSVHLISASQLVRCYISDITKRKQAEELLKQAHKDLEKRVTQRTLELDKNNQILKSEIAERKRVELEIRLLQTITQAISEAPSFDEAIAITLQKVCQTVSWGYGEAWIPDSQNNSLQISPAWYGSTTQLKYFYEASKKFNFPQNVGKPGRVWATKQPEWTEDVTVQDGEIFLRKEVAREVGLKTALGVPIVADDEVIAVFVFFDFFARTKNEQTVELVTSVAERLGLVMERKQGEDALRSSMATNRAILNAIPDLIFRINKAGIVVNFKAGKGKNLLTPDREFLHQHVMDVFPPEIAPPILNCLEQTFATGELQFLECQITRQDKVYSYEIRFAISDIDEVMAIVRDITERKQAEADIRRTLEQEKKLNDLKSRFVTMASHEFRTPLTSILSSAELLEHYSHKWTPEKQLKYLSRIQTSVKHMTELLNDVLLLGKADAGQLKLVPVNINLYQFCQELVEEIAMSCQTHQIIFNTKNCFDNSEDCEQNSTDASNDCERVCLDEKMLRHIVNNLLSNAIKYSPDSDRVIFDLSCQSQQAVFKIQDFGIGVPPSELDRLFDSFHRAENVGSIPGTGLGLPIVKRSVDMLGGTIEVDSQVNVGTTFTVTLPYLKQNEC